MSPQLLILQHPQEPGVELGSASLLHEIWPQTRLKVGLSWRSLKHASGDENAKASDWLVLYWGSGPKAGPGVASTVDLKAVRPPALIELNRKGVPIPDRGPVSGLIVLDGTWSQAKTLWWRNAWLLKLRRAVLLPAEESLYGKKRKEPRRECLSTVESAGLALSLLSKDQMRTFDQARARFAEFLK